MKIKLILSIALIVILSFGGYFYYLTTDSGKFNLFVKSTLNHVEHGAKARDYGVEIDEVISWYGTDFKRNNPPLTKCIIEGIKYAYSRSELTPSEIKISYKRIIEDKKIYWLKRIKK